MTNYSDLTNLSEILKDIYGTGLKNQFNDEKTTYNLFPKSEKQPRGNGYIFGLRYARNQSVGARAESKVLPDPMTGKKDKGRIVDRYIYGTLRITGPSIEIAKGDMGAFVNGLADEMDDIYQSVVVDMNRQANSDGFGKVGVCSASFAPATGASSTYAVTFDNDLGIQFMQEGMLIDFFSSDGANYVHTCCGQKIKSIIPSTKVVIFEGSVNTSLANHPDSTIAGLTNATTPVPVSSIAVKMGAREAAWATTDTPNEITGLDGIFDDATLLASFEDIDVAANPKWAANRIAHSGVNRELEIDLMLNALDLTRTRSGMNANTIHCGIGQRRKYANLLLPDVRYAPQELKGGYQTLAFAGGDGSVKIIVDVMAQPNKMRFYPEGTIQKYEILPLGWGNLDGDKMHRRSGYDEWDLFLRLYTQMGCEQRNCLTTLDDLAEPALY